MTVPNATAISVNMLRFAQIFTFALLLVTGAYLLFFPSEQQVDIGGDFTLKNQHGETITNESLKGKPRLVYFGFTHCPDLCPMALTVMSQAAQELGDSAPQLVFITIDPERDTVKQLNAYAENFPGLIALTGSAESIKQAAQVYRIYYKKSGDVTGPDYVMDHSSYIYLMDEEGKYLAHFAHTVAAAELTEGIKQHIH